MINWLVMMNRISLPMIMLSLGLVTLSGCNNNYRFSIACDSGFKIDSASYALIDKGVVQWRDTDKQWSKRLMIQGEVCQVKRFKVPKPPLRLKR